MFGLARSGKTTIRKWLFNELISINDAFATIEYSRREQTINDTEIIFFDLGGGPAYLELQAEIERISAATPTAPSDVVTTEPTSTITSVQPTGSYEVATVVVTLFEEVLSRKSKSALPKHVLNALRAPINDFDQVYSRILDQMLERGFLKETPKNYSKTDSWSRQALINFCKEFKK